MKSKCEHLNVKCVDCDKELYLGLTEEQKNRFAWDMINFLRSLGYEDALVLYRLRDEMELGNETASRAFKLLAPLNKEGGND